MITRKFDELLFPMFLEEREYPIEIFSAKGIEKPITYKRVIVVEYYLANLFELTYKVRTEIENTISLKGRRYLREIIWHSDFMPEDDMKYKLHTFLETFQKEKEKVEQESKAYYNTGNCVICQEQQTHSTMSIDKHVCVPCKSYAEFIIFRYELGIIETHKLIEERRLAQKDKKWYVMIFPEEVKIIA